VVRLLYELLPELRDQKGLSQEALAYRTGDPSSGGISVGSIRQYEKRGRAGVVPEVEILEALAEALEVNVETFYEYPLAKARREARPATSRRRGAAAAKPTDAGAPPIPGETGRRLSGDRPKVQGRSEPGSDRDTGAA
jgi:transcriptional regulator with XRE-family HTH domain